jgi:hypothetical protein
VGVSMPAPALTAWELWVRREFSGVGGGEPAGASAGAGRGNRTDDIDGLAVDQSPSHPKKIHRRGWEVAPVLSTDHAARRASAGPSKLACGS